jgi:hypothetical protein
MRLTGRVILIPSVVVHDLNLCGANFSPDEADAPLVIDPYAVLTLSIIFQRFQKRKGGFWRSPRGIRL